MQHIVAAQFAHWCYLVLNDWTHQVIKFFWSTLNLKIASLLQPYGEYKAFTFGLLSIALREGLFTWDVPFNNLKVAFQFDDLEWKFPLSFEAGNVGLTFTTTSAGLPEASWTVGEQSGEICPQSAENPSFEQNGAKIPPCVGCSTPLNFHHPILKIDLRSVFLQAPYLCLGFLHLFNRLILRFLRIKANRLAIACHEADSPRDPFIQFVLQGISLVHSKSEFEAHIRRSEVQIASTHEAQVKSEVPLLMISSHHPVQDAICLKWFLGSEVQTQPKKVSVVAPSQSFLPGIDKPTLWISASTRDVDVQVDLASQMEKIQSWVQWLHERLNLQRQQNSLACTQRLAERPESFDGVDRIEFAHHLATRPALGWIRSNTLLSDLPALCLMGVGEESLEVKMKWTCWGLRGICWSSSKVPQGLELHLKRIRGSASFSNAATLNFLSLGTCRLHVSQQYAKECKSSPRPSGFKPPFNLPERNLTSAIETSASFDPNTSLEDQSNSVHLKWPCVTILDHPLTWLAPQTMLGSPPRVYEDVLDDSIPSRIPTHSKKMPRPFGPRSRCCPCPSDPAILLLTDSLHSQLSNASVSLWMAPALIEVHTAAQIVLDKLWTDWTRLWDEKSSSTVHLASLDNERQYIETKIFLWAPLVRFSLASETKKSAYLVLDVCDFISVNESLKSCTQRETYQVAAHLSLLTCPMEPQFQSQLLFSTFDGSQKAAASRFKEDQDCRLLARYLPDEARAVFMRLNLLDLHKTLEPVVDAEDILEQWQDICTLETEIHSPQNLILGSKPASPLSFAVTLCCPRAFANCSLADLDFVLESVDILKGIDHSCCTPTSLTPQLESLASVNLQLANFDLQIRSVDGDIVRLEFLEWNLHLTRGLAVQTLKEENASKHLIFKGNLRCHRTRLHLIRPSLISRCILNTLCVPGSESVCPWLSMSCDYQPSGTVLKCSITGVEVLLLEGLFKVLIQLIDWLDIDPDIPPLIRFEDLAFPVTADFKAKLLRVSHGHDPPPQDAVISFDLESFVTLVVGCLVCHFSATSSSYLTHRWSCTSRSPISVKVSHISASQKSAHKIESLGAKTKSLQPVLFDLGVFVVHYHFEQPDSVQSLHVSISFIRLLLSVLSVRQLAFYQGIFESLATGFSSASSDIVYHPWKLDCSLQNVTLNFSLISSANVLLSPLLVSRWVKPISCLVLEGVSITRMLRTQLLTCCMEKAVCSDLRLEEDLHFGQFHLKIKKVEVLDLVKKSKCKYFLRLMPSPRQPSAVGILINEYLYLKSQCLPEETRIYINETPTPCPSAHARQRWTLLDAPTESCPEDNPLEETLNLDWSSSSSSSESTLAPDPIRASGVLSSENNNDIPTMTAQDLRPDYVESQHPHEHAACNTSNGVLTWTCTIQCTCEKILITANQSFLSAFTAVTSRILQSCQLHFLPKETADCNESIMSETSSNSESLSPSKVPPSHLRHHFIKIAEQGLPVPSLTEPRIIRSISLPALQILIDLYPVSPRFRELRPSPLQQTVKSKSTVNLMYTLLFSVGGLRNFELTTKGYHLRGFLFLPSSNASAISGQRSGLASLLSDVSAHAPHDDQIILLEAMSQQYFYELWTPEFLLQVRAAIVRYHRDKKISLMSTVKLASRLLFHVPPLGRIGKVGSSAKVLFKDIVKLHKFARPQCGTIIDYTDPDFSDQLTTVQGSLGNFVKTCSLETINILGSVAETTQKLFLKVDPSRAAKHRRPILFLHGNDTALDAPSVSDTEPDTTLNVSNPIQRDVEDNLVYLTSPLVSRDGLLGETKAWNLIESQSGNLSVPLPLKDTIQDAYASIKKDWTEAAYKAYQLSRPQRAQRKASTFSNRLRSSAVDILPAAVLRPLVNISEIVVVTLKTLQHQIDPLHLERSIDGCKSPRVRSLDGSQLPNFPPDDQEFL